MPPPTPPNDSSNKPSAIIAPGPPNYYILRHLRSASRDPIGYYTKFWKEYGDIVRVHWFGNTHAHLCLHPSMVEHVLQANWSNYSKGFFYKRLSIFTGNGLFTSSGETWKTQRRLAQPAFHRAKIENLANLMATTVEEMCQRWEEEDRTRDASAPFDLAGETMRLALQIAGRALFGSDLQGKEAHRFHELMNAAMSHVEHRFNPLTLPENIPTRRNQKFLKAKAELDEWITKLVRERAAHTGPEHDDLLQILVDARDPESGQGLSERQLIDEVITLLVAGHETSADALAWGFALLAQNPHTREELESELSHINGKTLQFADLADLPYSKMVFEESLRLYPPIWALAREANEADEIGGFPIEARSSVITLPFLTHRHPDFWEAPEKFDPTRFSEKNRLNRAKFAYFPFGGGPRLCIGQQFALMEGQIALAIISSRYRLELAPFEKLEMHPSLALRPRNGLWMIRRKRS